MDRKFQITVAPFEDGVQVKISSNLSSKEVSMLTHLDGVTDVFQVNPIQGYEAQTIVTLRATKEGVQQIFNTLGLMNQGQSKIKATAEEAAPSTDGPRPLRAD